MSSARLQHHQHGSTIQVQLAGYTPVFGDVFNLLDWASINSGTFDPAIATDLDLSNAILTSGLTWDTSQFLGSGVIFVTPEPGRAVLSLMAVVAMLLRRRRA